MSKIVRLSDESYAKLGSIAQVIGISKQDVLDVALANLEKDTLLKQANEAYAAQAKNNKEWQEELEEQALWDATLSDGECDE